ncbi:MAG: SEC-C domain-containing protein [Bacteroidales bacterium]|nr:SEC-C domain-containing protein [Bacteroidales bacterium]
MVDMVYDHVYGNYKERMQRLADLAFPFIKNVYENTRYENVAFPITDGKKIMNVVTPVKKSFETQGRELSLSIEKIITLAIIDEQWKEHLRELDDLKQSVQNATYEQKDPLLIYKFESFNLFEKMLLSINREISSFLSRAALPTREDANMREAKQPTNDDRNLKTSREDEVLNQRTSEPQKTQPVRVEKKVGRNDPCPCGSGKKYKQCHGKNEAV